MPREHGAPKQIDAQGPGDYLEVMTKAAFQAGMSWDVIEAKWDGFREAFHGFDAERVAALAPDEIDALCEDTRIIRNRRKIEATRDNAEAILELAAEHGGDFRNYLRSHNGFEATVKDMRKQFSFLGDFGAFYFLYVVREAVPAYEDWKASRGRP